MAKQTHLRVTADVKEKLFITSSPEDGLVKAETRPEKKKMDTENLK